MEMSHWHMCKHSSPFFVFVAPGDNRPNPIVDNKNNISPAPPSALLWALPGCDDDERMKEGNDFVGDDELIEGPVTVL